MVNTKGPVTTPWLMRLKQNPSARLRLFCFPYAGGSALIYRGWLDKLPMMVDVCPVQPPGRGSRLKEPLFTRLTPMVEALADAIQAHLDRPFAFFGHSLGAMIAFETSRELRKRQWPQPVHLFVSGRPAPHFPDVDPVTYNLPEPEFIEELRRLNGTPPEVLEHPELMSLMSPIIRADFEVVQTYSYSPGAMLSCPITAFGGIGDEEVSRNHLEGWRQHTTGDFTLRILPGDHFFLHQSEPLLLELLSQELHRIVSLLASK